MTRKEFETLVEEEFPNAVPEKFRHLIKNVAFLVENEPDEATRKEEGLTSNETLLGLYKGIPATARGDYYGVGNTLPDTITLYQIPIEEEAEVLASLAQRDGASGTNSQQGIMSARQNPSFTRRVIRETIWHEVAHHFGYDEHQVRDREQRDGIV